MDKRIVLTAQIFITFMMAFLMSGIMSLIALGPTSLWLQVWPRQFIIAWPVAFCLTLVVSRVGFFCATRIVARMDG